MEYYQLGGFDASVHSHPRYPLGPKVYEALRKHQHPDTPETQLDLVLGITSSGTSHLLISRDEYAAIYNEAQKKEAPAREAFYRTKFFKKKDRDAAWVALDQMLLRWQRTLRFSAADFESVSPALFADCRALDKKLESLRPGKRATYDTSSANKMYRDTTPDARGQFENSRVLYRVLNKQVTRSSCDLGDTSWSTSLRVFSLCYNIWSFDNQWRKDPRLVPKLLDIGWCEAVTPALTGDMKMEKHIVIGENRKFAKPPGTTKRTDVPDIDVGKPDRYEYGETEICDNNVAAQRIQTTFGKYTNSTPHATILLVHDAKTAMVVLESLGLDVSQWEFRLKNLLWTQGSYAPTLQNPRGRSRDDNTARARSKSPTRGARPRASSPPSRRYAPIYVVDIKALFSALLGSHGHAQTVPDICRRLGLFQPKSWCAGNEAWMLVEVFRRMAGGRSIDEQRVDWTQTQGSGVDGDDSDYGEFNSEGDD
ncbi:hypothetical protein B0H11DRAFT_2059230 [Mycena galericulata]|nr:hypothetical protein B0H11DRAFT_2059230 [Mycena galericulata]